MKKGFVRLTMCVNYGELIFFAGVQDMLYSRHSLGSLEYSPYWHHKLPNLDRGQSSK